jgi:hypothetical protein
MNWIALLGQMIPVLGGIAGHPELAVLAQKLLAIGEQEVERRIAQTGQTREQILADASEAWNEAIKGADDLKNME